MPDTPLNVAGKRVILGLSGGVDSAVSALLLQQAGADVHALHMTNWEDDDGYCTAADDLQDARRICEQLGIPLHHVNFAREYRDRVFEYFLDEYRRGRTPNPDVLCNREIKFGVFRDYAKRLGGDLLATGHYARVEHDGTAAKLVKARDRNKDQTYFLHAVTAEALAETVFPLGDLDKQQVRDIAHEHGLVVHAKKDSTGICFIGERPFREFLQTYLPANPGRMLTPDGDEVGEHAGLMFYTLGQRQGLGIGGRADAGDAPWYVIDKHLDDNTLIVAQGEHERLFSHALDASQLSWIGEPPDDLVGRRFGVKVRYRQPDQGATVIAADGDSLTLAFDDPQRAVAPGQFAVFYDGDVCLGGAVIDRLIRDKPAVPSAASA
ncbi:MAG: tRNA 2-thiouridine(34) synthase MnmA [Pseudomonadota bacterium]